MNPNLLHRVPAEVNVVLGVIVAGLAIAFVRQLRSTNDLSVKLCRLQAFIHARRYLEAHRHDGSLMPAELFNGELFLNEKGAEFGFVPYPNALERGAEP